VILPVATGIAILRYRLCDIDRLINRTLVYGLLTALLGLVYAGAVLVLGAAVRGDRRRAAEWAVAGATLTVAALFQPARRRIQRAVDRRFNGASTTPPRPVKRSAPACETRSTWTHCRPSCLGLWIRRCSRPRRGCGFDRPPMAPRAPLAVRQELLSRLSWWNASARTSRGSRSERFRTVRRSSHWVRARP